MTLYPPREGELRDNMGRFGPQGPAVQSGRFREQNSLLDDDGVFSEAPARPTYTEMGRQFYPQLGGEVSRGEFLKSKGSEGWNSISKER